MVIQIGLSLSIKKGYRNNWYLTDFVAKRAVQPLCESKPSSQLHSLYVNISKKIPQRMSNYDNTSTFLFD